MDLKYDKLPLDGDISLPDLLSSLPFTPPPAPVLTSYNAVLFSNKFINTSEHPVEFKKLLGYEEGKASKRLIHALKRIKSKGYYADNTRDLLEMVDIHSFESEPSYQMFTFAVMGL